MRFQFLEPRKDVASAEQVRSLRERRGWTAEEMADEVHASPLEVSAWEAGTVEVPSRQALLIRWQTERAVWSEALKGAQAQTCTWVPENAPDLYEHMFRKPDGSWYARDALVAAHLADCARCKDVWQQAKRIGGFPAKPDTSGSLRARYWHWVSRLPRRARRTFVLASLFAPFVGFGLPILTADHAPGLWGYVQALMSGAMLGMIASLLVIGMSSHRRMATLLRGLAAGAGGLLGWAVFEGSIDLSDPRLWAAAMTGGFGVGLFELRVDALPRRKAKARAARIQPARELPPELPTVLPSGDAAEIGGLTGEWRTHQAREPAGAQPEVRILDRGTPA